MAKPKQMVPKDDSTKMDAPQEQEQPSLESAAPEAASDEAAPEAADQPKRKRKGKKVKALVNMHLPSGEVLSQGEEIELSKAGHDHLDKHFAESKHHIIEE